MKNDQPSALAPVPNSEPTAAARSAGLRYVTDSMRGIARVAKRDHFHYDVDADGNAVDDPDTLARIKSLVIPPAWTDVWICPLANGHLQATGALALQEFEKFDSEAQAKKNIVRAIESVAEKLGNTPTICRKCYVHPAIIDAYLDGTIMEALRERARRELVDDLHNLTPEEAAVLALPQPRLQHPDPAPAKRPRSRRQAA